VYINYPSYSVRADVYSSPFKINAESHLDYYWYASNKIFHTQGGCDGKILNGSFASFYLSNNLKEKGNFKKGLKDKDWIEWFENGMIKTTAAWKSGKLHGTQLIYNEKGELLSKSNFKKGELHRFKYTYEEGKLKTKQKYRHGKEIIKKKNADKTLPVPATEEKKDQKPEVKKKKSIKEKINGLFHKKTEQENKLPEKQYEKKKEKISFLSRFKKNKKSKVDIEDKIPSEQKNKKKKSAKK
jgi:hypothetical protein